MSRTDRLFQLLQILRRHRHPVSGQRLASELNISLRTLYRDIASLQAQGAEISGEAGVGYVLKPSFMLPPLMFSEEEIESLVLGIRWVSKKTDDTLGAAATNALAKIAAVLPPKLRGQLDLSSLLVGPSQTISAEEEPLTLIRQAIRFEREICMLYEDGQGQQTKRTVWPIGLAYFDQVRVMIAWCQLRQDFRHFRADRICQIEVNETRYPKSKALLLKQWRAIHNIPSS
ncbi:helix-turn-helix transcriptional regulator [Legionella sp. W05-934-2]|jgi:predicted DNA-binding transcriptional regulator YafY|uniref:helix-turn-helix transcriptional regulator n=1 Tax=Legionella sp. W05-934-2 TaxID=1198649 RepID=UPI003462CFA3